MTPEGILPVLTAWVLLVLPGYLVLRLLPGRIPFPAGSAPAVTVLLTLGVGAVLGILRLPFTRSTAAVAAAVLLLLLLGLRTLHRRRRGSRAPQRPAPHRPAPFTETPGRPRRRPRIERITLLLPGAAALLAGAATVLSAESGMASLRALNGSFDSFFHLAAIAFIRRDQDGFLPTALEGIYHRPTLYPVGWDVLTSLLPFDTVVAANAMALVTLAVLPAAMAAMVLVLLETRAPQPHVSLVAAGAALVSPVFLSIPAMALVMGLWPFVLGSVCLPAALGALVVLQRRITAATRGRGTARRAALRGTIAPLAVVLGTIIVHPSHAFSLGLAVFVAALLLSLRAVRHRAGRRRGLWGLLACAVLLVVYTISCFVQLENMSMTARSPWPILITLASTLLERPRLSQIPGTLWPLALVWLLALVGVLRHARDHDRIPAIAMATLGLTIVLSILTQYPRLLLAVWTNPWYGARERIAPLLVCALVTLFALGLLELLGGLRRRSPAADGGRVAAGRGPIGSGGRGAAFGAAGLVLVLVIALAAVALPSRLPLLSSLSYRDDDQQLSPYVTGAERDFIVSAAAQLPPDAVVIGNPRDGLPAFWSLGGTQVVFPTMSEPQTLDSRRAARYGWKADRDPKVCTSWRAVGATHLYVDTSEISGEELSPRTDRLWDGLDRIPPDHLEVVAHEGDWTLYRIDPLC